MNPIIRLVDSTDLESLKEQADANEKRRSRICLHKGHESSIQQMLIHLNDDSWVPVHRQPNQTETFLIFEGEIKVLFFDDDGNVEASKTLRPDGLRVIHFDANIWHTCVALTPNATFYEITEGPYDAENTSWAPWCNQNFDSTGYMNFLKGFNC